MKVRKFAMEFFSRFIFGPGIFWRFDFCPHSIIPITWNPEPTPLGQHQLQSWSDTRASYLPTWFIFPSATKKFEPVSPLMTARTAGIKPLWTWRPGKTWKMYGEYKHRLSAQRLPYWLSRPLPKLISFRLLFLIAVCTVISDLNIKKGKSIPSDVVTSFSLWHSYWRIKCCFLPRRRPATMSRDTSISHPNAVLSWNLVSRTWTIIGHEYHILLIPWVS